MKCISTDTKWQYDSCKQTMDAKENENPDVNKMWESLKHICPECGNLRME